MVKRRTLEQHAGHNFFYTYLAMSLLTSILGKAVNTDADEYLGKPTRRVDGPAKVSGAAKYAAEFNVPDLAYGYIVSGAEARGTITSINTAEVEAIPGVLKVFTHENAPKTACSTAATATKLRPRAARPFGHSTRPNSNTARNPLRWWWARPSRSPASPHRSSG